MWDDYVRNVQNQLAKILYEGLFELTEQEGAPDTEEKKQPEQPKPEAASESQREEEMKVDPTPEEEKEAKGQEQEPKKEKEKPEQSKNEKKQEPDCSPVRQFFFRSSVTESRGGRSRSERIEEHRERIMGSDGSVHTVTRRQIGDRWYVHESHSTKDGESSSKETWHNVPEESIDSFKKEWECKNCLKHEAPEAASETSETSGTPALPKETETEE